MNLSILAVRLRLNRSGTATNARVMQTTETSIGGNRLEKNMTNPSETRIGQDNMK